MQAEQQPQQRRLAAAIAADDRMEPWRREGDARLVDRGAGVSEILPMDWRQVT
jgi:hypothetical protein